MNSPMWRQLFVASSPQLAAMSVGGVVGFPNVILEQLRSNDSSIYVDLDMATWIGSTHGLAGIPSIAMPTLMQWKGRKFSFLLCCLIVITGWVLTYFSQNVMTIIIAECFHGLGSNSIIIVSFYAISEMVAPKYRMISMSFYTINQNFGLAIVGILGRYLHWKTVSIIMSIPVIIAFLFGCVWPESPAWLAYKGEYSECEKAFRWLRGSDKDAQKELKEILNAEREKANTNSKLTFQGLWLQISSRDFYLPCIHSFVCICAFYWSGVMVVVIYGMDMIRSATKNPTAAHYGMIAIDFAVYLGTFATAFLLKIFKNRTLFLSSGFMSALFLFGASAVSLLQSSNVLSSESLLCLYFLLGFMIAVSLGMTTVCFIVPAELMPVKHRGLGGAVFVILVCTGHTSSLKISPYLFLYLGLWGTLLLYTANCLICMTVIWKYIPETKGRTLQELEDYYNYGHFDGKRKQYVEETDERFLELNK